MVVYAVASPGSWGRGGKIVVFPGLRGGVRGGGCAPSPGKKIFEKVMHFVGF